VSQDLGRLDVRVSFRAGGGRDFTVETLDGNHDLLRIVMGTTNIGSDAAMEFDRAAAYRLVEALNIVLDVGQV
jgi:hypothetical protein